MTRDEIADRAKTIQKEIDGLSVPYTTSGGKKLFDKAKVIFNDMAVLIRELAECK